MQDSCVTKRSHCIQQQLLQCPPLPAEPAEGQRQHQPPPAELLAAIGEAAHHPEHELPQGAVVGEVHQPGHGRIGEDADGHPEQQQAERGERQRDHPLLAQHGAESAPGAGVGMAIGAAFPGPHATD